MKKEKDPAFLFYPKDWIGGTADFLPEEKGIYIDLLCYQHQHGGIPIDTMRLARIVGLSEEQFNKLWVMVSPKFHQLGNRLVNQKLQGLMQDRIDRGHINRINGTFAGLLRMGNFTKEEYAELRKGFNASDFMEIPDDGVTDAITKWITNRYPSRLKSIGNGNGNGNKDENAFQDEDVNGIFSQEDISNGELMF